MIFLCCGQKKSKNHLFVTNNYCVYSNFKSIFIHEDNLKQSQSEKYLGDVISHKRMRQ